MSNYSPKDIFLERRTANNTFEEYPLHVQPNSVLTTDINGNLVMVDTASFIAGTGSIAFAVSSSVSQTASYLLGLSDTSSFAVSSSHAFNLREGSSIYLSQSYIFSNISASVPPHVKGQIWWDKTNHTYTIDTLQSRLQIGQENYVRALAGEYVPNGAPVYLDGVLPDPDDPGLFIPVAYLAIADGTGLKASVVGVSTQELFFGDEGFITTQGIVNEVNTGLLSQGTQIYLSSTESGSFVDSIPPDPSEKIIIGTNLYSHAADGRILVQISVLPPLTAPFVGLITTASFTDNGNSTCTVGQAQANFCVTADGLGQIKSYSIPSATLSCSVGTFTQYVMAHWNSGSPEYMISTDNTMIDEIQVVSAFTVIQAFSGSGIAAVDWDAPGTLLANKLLLRTEDVNAVERATGLILGISGSYITITSGSVWWGVKNKLCPEVNTSDTSSSPLLFYYHSQSAWKASTVTDGKFINSVVDDRVNQLPIPYGNYVVNYIYRGLGTLNRTLVIVSDAMDNITEAQIFAPPSPPSYFNELNTLVGRIIVQSGSWVPTSVDSAFLSSLPLTTTPQHNDLFNIQGGSGSALAGEFYHLTTAEYTGLGVSASYAQSASYLIPGNPLHLSNSYIQSAVSMSAPPWKEGRLFWDKVNHTYALYNDVNGVTLQLGQESYIHAIAGENIADASAVYIDGPMQDVDNPTNWMPKIYRALADTTATPGIDRVAGITTHAFTSGSAGWVTTTGVIHDVDTSTFTPGAILYLSPTVLGGYQENNPGQPYSTVEVGTVIQSDVNGSILVKINVIPPPVSAYAGMITVPSIDTSLNNGTIIVSTGSVNLYDSPSGVGAVTTYDIPETTLNLISGSTNYIVGRVSSSMTQGEYFLTTDATYANGISIIRVAQLDIYNETTSSWDVHNFQIGIVGLALSNRINNKDIKLYGFQRQDGLTLYTTGSEGQFGITEGNIWYGPNSHLVATFDTTLSGHYTYIFHTTQSNGTASWHQHTSSVFLDGVYDSGSYGLTAVPETSWSVNYVYRIIGTSDESAIVLSNNWYSTELEASNNASTPANLPSTIRDQCLLVGRFIVQSGSISTPTIESAFSNIFIPAVVTDHESLLGLQGSTIGGGGGHYHLSATDYAGTGTGVVVRNNKPTFVGATPYHIPYWNPQQQLTLTGSVQVYEDKYVIINSGSVTSNNPEALLVQQLNTSSVNTIGAYADVDNYSQIYNQNFSSGSDASTDFCATSNTGSQDTYYIDMGIASSGYNSSFWPWVKANDGYLEMDHGDLWLATLTDNKILFAFNNTASTAYADKTGFYLSGSFYGTASWANNIISSSHAVTASYALNVPLTASNADTASISFTASYANTASYVSNLYPQTYQESGSWASASLSASYVPDLYPQTYQESGSWASASLSASYVPDLYPQTYQESGSWASASLSASYVPDLYPQTYQESGSWASASLSASYVPDLYPQTYQESGSWASSSLSASHATTASYAFGIPAIKSGVVVTGFNGTPRSASVVFTTPFGGVYSVTITGQEPRMWAAQNVNTNSFTINSNSDVEPDLPVYWQAIGLGEFYSTGELPS